MENLKDACTLSNEEWFNELTVDYYKSKEAFNKKILNKKVVKSLIIAAAVLVLIIATTVFAIPSHRNFIIKRFSDGSLYSVQPDSFNAANSDLQVTYALDCFTVTETYYDSDNYITAYEYSNKDKSVQYTVDKIKDDADVYFDTEEYQIKQCEFNGITYTFYKSTEYNNAVIWNYGGYIYNVSGNISVEDAYEIAKCTK